MTTTASDLDRYLQVLAGPSPTGRLIEIRSANPAGTMRQTFTPATRPDLAANAITRLAAHTDVYVGVLLRRRRSGGRDACEHSHLAFVEIDRPDGADRLARYRCPPTMIIASGGSPGHAHAYWQLHQPANLDELESANRRLAIRLGGDLASVDAARILRPPTSWNRKHTPPARVELLELEPSRRYTLAELTAGLTDPRPKPISASPSARTATSDLDRQLLAIPAATYVLALTGRHPNRARKIPCPFHDLSVGEATAGGVLPARSLAVDARTGESILRDILRAIARRVRATRDAVAGVRAAWTAAATTAKRSTTRSRENKTNNDGQREGGGACPCAVGRVTAVRHPTARARGQCRSADTFFTVAGQLRVTGLACLISGAGHVVSAGEAGTAAGDQPLGDCDGGERRGRGRERVCDVNCRCPLRRRSARRRPG